MSLNTQLFEPTSVLHIEDAHARIQLWQEKQRLIREAYPQATPVLSINAFTFKFLEIFNLCIRIHNTNFPDKPMEYYTPCNDQNLQLDALRLYLGIKPALDGALEEACLVCLPVEHFEYEGAVSGGSDVAEMKLYPDKVMTSLYDFSFPCPSTCAVNDIFPKTGCR